MTHSREELAVSLAGWTAQGNGSVSALETHVHKELLWGGKDSLTNPETAEGFFWPFTDVEKGTYQTFIVFADSVLWKV